MNLTRFLNADRSRREALAAAYVVPESSRCVQCGICSFNCPLDIDVRHYAWTGAPVRESACVTCGECVRRCPRGVLRFENTQLFNGIDTI